MGKERVRKKGREREKKPAIEKKTTRIYFFALKNVLLNNQVSKVKYWEIHTVTI